MNGGTLSGRGDEGMRESNTHGSPFQYRSLSAMDRLLFPFRWVRDSVRAWLFCERHGNDHDWTYNDDQTPPYCEICGIPGSWADA